MEIRESEGFIYRIWNKAVTWKSGKSQGFLYRIWNKAVTWKSGKIRGSYTDYGIKLLHGYQGKSGVLILNME